MSIKLNIKVLIRRITLEWLLVGNAILMYCIVICFIFVIEQILYAKILQDTLIEQSICKSYYIIAFSKKFFQ